MIEWSNLLLGSWRSMLMRRLLRLLAHTPHVRPQHLTQYSTVCENVRAADELKPRLMQWRRCPCALFA